MTDAQARSLVRLLWLAATTTTGRVIASCALRLLIDPPLAGALRRDDSLVPPFVEEVLRLHPPELMVPRRDHGGGGTGRTADSRRRARVSVRRRGQPRPRRNSSGPRSSGCARPPGRHFSFGYGIHHCVGASLGRRTIEIAVRALLAYAPGFRAAEPLDSVVTWCSMTASPVGRLPVEFTP